MEQLEHGHFMAAILDMVLVTQALAAQALVARALVARALVHRFITNKIRNSSCSCFLFLHRFKRIFRKKGEIN